MNKYLMRLCLTALSLTLCLAYPTAMTAQKKSGSQTRTATTQKKTTAKPAQQKKTAAKPAQQKKTTSKPAQQKTAAPAARGGSSYFEGALLYRSYEYHSSVVRKFSYGRAYNGERSIKVTMKGADLHIVDESMHLHTIILPGSNTGYIYSDVAKQGIKASLKFLDDYLRVLDPDYQSSNGLKKMSQLRNTGESVDYKGDRCKVYKGYMMHGEDTKTDVEMWYTEKYRVHPSYRYVFGGLNPGGLLRKGIYNQSGKIPLLGSMKSLVSSELVALRSYKVPASEMRPPADIVIRQATDNKQIVDLYKENRSQLKKHKLTPKPKKTSEVKYDLRKQWDFADEWIASNYDSGRKDDSWEKIGNALFDIAKSIAAIGNSTPKENARQRQQKGATGMAADVGAEMATTSEGDAPDSQIDADKEKQLTPEEQQKLEKLKKKHDRVKRDWYETDKQAVRAANAGYITGNGATSDRMFDKAMDLFDEMWDVNLEMYKLVAKPNASQLKNRSDYHERKKKDYRKKTESAKLTFWKNSRGKKIINYYSDYRIEIYSIKINSASYNRLTVGEKMNIIRRNQKKMKELRKEWRDRTGKDLHTADNSLENWNPTEKELLKD